jgi:hypothetical protein
MNKFMHGGKLGDLILALWTIRKVGDAYLYFNCSPGSLWKPEYTEFCRSFLERQSYIRGFENVYLDEAFHNNVGEKLFCRQDPKHPDWLILDNAWYWGAKRELCKAWGCQTNQTHEAFHWINRYAYMLGVKVDACECPVENIPIIGNDKVACALTNHLGRRYSDEFYAEFLKGFDVVRLDFGVFPTMLDLMVFLRGCRAYVGTSTMPYALSQAFCMPRVVERPTNNWFWDAWPIGPMGFVLDSWLEGRAKNLQDVFDGGFSLQHKEIEQ